jgi:DNA oxidative demethylase
MKTRRMTDPPEGWRYEENFLSLEEERSLVEEFEKLPLAPLQMHGVISKRELMHYGWDYHYDAMTIRPTERPPDFLHSIQERAARLANIAPAALEEILLTRYPLGSGIGWHRDAPMFGSLIIGISLVSPCMMKLRKKMDDVYHTYATELRPRSIYFLTGKARTQWQHSIPSIKALRYSITFRTVHSRFKQLSRALAF